MSGKYLGYIRVSTASQVKRGHSLEYQEEAIRKYCDAYNLTLVHPLYVDRGLSAVKDRPRFNSMMQRILNDNDVMGVVVHDLTRFGRSTEELLTQIKLLDMHGKRFISIKENLDISTKTGRMTLGFLALIADFERETILERMREGKEYARVHGTKSGLPMHRPRKVIDWGEVKRLRREGISWNRTARLVGVSTPTLISRARSEGYYE